MWIYILIVIIIILLGGSYINKKNKIQYNLIKEEKYIEEIYSKFILGEITVKYNNKDYLISNLIEPKYFEYYYCDIDEDSLKELHIKSDKLYYVLKYNNSLLNIIYEGSIYEYPVNNNNVVGVIYFRPGGAPEHVTYQFTTFELTGIVKSIIMFEWYDDNENQIMDEEDIYLYNDSEMIGMSQWKEVTEIYRDSILDAIKEEWKSKETETTAYENVVQEKEPATEDAQPSASDNTKQEVSENNSDDYLADVHNASSETISCKKNISPISDKEIDMPIFVPGNVDTNTFKHEKNRNTYTVNIEEDNSGGYLMHLHNLELDTLQSIPVETLGFSIRDFGDVNLDGYTDIVVYVGGTLNEMHELYVFDPTTQLFMPVLFEGFEMLSYFEVYDGYIMNWAKGSVDTVYIQKLVWKDNKLLLHSEEYIKLE